MILDELIEEQEKINLAFLELDRQKELRKIKRYRLLMQGAQKRLAEIEKKIEEIPKTY